MQAPDRDVIPAFHHRIRTLDDGGERRLGNLRAHSRLRRRVLKNGLGVSAVLKNGQFPLPKLDTISAVANTGPVLPGTPPRAKCATAWEAARLGVWIRFE
jgi:hypothetical protein